MYVAWQNNRKPHPHHKPSHNKQCNKYKKLQATNNRIFLGIFINGGKTYFAERMDRFKSFQNQKGKKILQ